MVEPTRHECSLLALINGRGDEEGIRCAHGFLLRPGDQIESERGTYTVGPVRRDEEHQGEPA